MTDFSRLAVLNSGIAMVVTDLHGEWFPYQVLRDRFLALRAQGQADYLILCGDLVHATNSHVKDESWRILHDVMALQATYGRETIIMLVGNHEIPHIYDVMFSKGESFVLNAQLEWDLVRAEQQAGNRYSRQEVKAFLRRLPFYVVTQAGVTISHAGAPPFVTSAQILEEIITFDHDALLQLGTDWLKRYDLEKLRSHTEYKQRVYDFMAIDDPYDAQYTNLLRGEILSQTEPMFRLLWDTFFLSNERGRQLPTYLREVSQFLAHLSTYSPYEQRVLVAGHVITPGGYQILGNYKLRIASYAHATPPDEGVYLLLDCAKSVETARDLVNHLYPSMK